MTEQSSKNSHQNSSNKATIIFLSICAFVAITLIVGVSTIMGGSNNNKESSTGSSVIDTSGKQIITITAKDGYTPGIVNAQADKPTILKVKTKGTFDCSSALTIPSLKISKNLPPTGETPIEIPAQAAGTKLRGTCSMGMYSFTINFS